MKLDRWLGSQPEADVRATMQEEGCLRCFGCPHATVTASVISEMAVSTQATVSRLSARNLTLLDDPDGAISNMIGGHEKLQDDYRAQLRELTTPCIGWYDGMGGSEIPRPADMCNSPESGDPKIFIAAGWLLEKLSFFRSR